mgnify:CR=1 FL=1
MRIYTIIPDALYQSPRFSHVTNKVDWLEQLGVTVVVNLWKPDPEMQAQTAINYIHLPIPDGKTLDPDPLLSLADELAAGIPLGERTLVHCYGGKNRSGLMSALIVRAHYRISGGLALRAVREGRPRAVANETFADYLEKLPPPDEGSSILTSSPKSTKEEDRVR